MREGNSKGNSRRCVEEEGKEEETDRFRPSCQLCNNCFKLKKQTTALSIVNIGEQNIHHHVLLVLTAIVNNLKKMKDEYVSCQACS